MTKTNFSRYFHDEINEDNWEVCANKDGLLCVVDGDGVCIADNICHPSDALAMANAQRFANMTDGRTREVFSAVFQREFRLLNDKSKEDEGK